MSYTIVERARKRQSSRINNLLEGDPNTKFFHPKANGRRHRNHIQCLQNGHGWATSHADKVEVVQAHFESVMSSSDLQQWDFARNAIISPCFELSHLDEQFLEAEVFAAIRQTLHDKGLGSDVFTETFYRSCWQIIKADLMDAISTFHR